MKAKVVDGRKARALTPEELRRAANELGVNHERVAAWLRSQAKSRETAAAVKKLSDRARISMRDARRVIESGSAP